MKLERGMTPTGTRTFAHHDAIARSRPGTVLMVCEPCQVVNMHAGGIIELQSGQSLRARYALGGLSCEVAIGGRVLTVALQSEWFHCVEAARE